MRAGYWAAGTVPARRTVRARVPLPPEGSRTGARDLDQNVLTGLQLGHFILVIGHRADRDVIYLGDDVTAREANILGKSSRINLRDDGSRQRW